VAFRHPTTTRTPTHGKLEAILTQIQISLLVERECTDFYFFFEGLSVATANLADNPEMKMNGDGLCRDCVIEIEKKVCA
jgi:hypothetical protein